MFGTLTAATFKDLASRYLTKSSKVSLSGTAECEHCIDNQKSGKLTIEQVKALVSKAVRYENSKGVSIYITYCDMDAGHFGDANHSFAFKEVTEEATPVFYELSEMSPPIVIASQRAWDIFINGRLVDTVFFDTAMQLTDVRTSLMRDSGYGPNITVKLAVN